MPVCPAVARLLVNGYDLRKANIACGVVGFALDDMRACFRLARIPLRGERRAGRRGSQHAINIKLIPNHAYIISYALTETVVFCETVAPSEGEVMLTVGEAVSTGVVDRHAD